MNRVWMRTTPWLLCAAALAVTAQAQTARPENNTAQVIPGQIVVDEATGVVQNMKQQAELAGVMDHAKAVLIVPRYGADPARLVDRAERTSPSANTSLASDSMVKHGSPGVFLLHTAGWSAPAFFSVGKVPMSDTDNASNGAQNRQRGMPLVMMFMSARAAKQMQGSNKVSLAGLNVSHYSDRPRGSLSDADVVVWTPHAMPHDGDLAAAQIHYDDAASNAYYMNQATESQILSSNVSTARATRLQGALAQRVASSK